MDRFEKNTAVEVARIRACSGAPGSHCLRLVGAAAVIVRGRAVNDRLLQGQNHTTFLLRSNCFE